MVTCHQCGAEFIEPIEQNTYDVKMILEPRQPDRLDEVSPGKKTAVIGRLCKRCADGMYGDFVQVIVNCQQGKAAEKGDDLHEASERLRAIGRIVKTAAMIFSVTTPAMITSVTTPEDGSGFVGIHVREPGDAEKLHDLLVEAVEAVGKRPTTEESIEAIRKAAEVA